MLSYLIVILSLKKLGDGLQTDENTDWHKDKQFDTKTRKILRNQHSLLSMLVPRHRVSVLSTKCGGYLSKRLIIASLYKIKMILIITILLFTRQFSILLDKKKINWNSQNTWKICKFLFSGWKRLEGLLAYLVSYFANSMWRKFSVNGGISSLT